MCDYVIGFVIDEQRGLHSTFPTLMSFLLFSFLVFIRHFKEHRFWVLLINLNVLLLCLPFSHFFSLLLYFTILFITLSKFKDPVDFLSVS